MQKEGGESLFESLELLPTLFLINARRLYGELRHWLDLCARLWFQCASVAPIDMVGATPPHCSAALIAHLMQLIGQYINKATLQLLGASTD